MDQKENDNISKFLSFVLRHAPQEIELDMSESGWVEISQLINNSKVHKGWDLSIEKINHVVKTNNKQRFLLSDDGLMIKANQGHSVEVFLDLPDVEPPEFLYHGTATRFLDAILKTGLKPMQRHDVHLSFDTTTALNVGIRHGKPVILIVKAKEMVKNGHAFKCTKNNVWLTKEVPPEFLIVSE